MGRALFMHCIAFYSFLACLIYWPLFCFPHHYNYIALDPTIILLLLTWKNGPFGGYIFRESSPLLFLCFDPKDKDLKEKSTRELNLLTASLMNNAVSLDPDEIALRKFGEFVDKNDELSIFLDSLDMHKLYFNAFKNQNITYEMLQYLDSDDYSALG